MLYVHVNGFMFCGCCMQVDGLFVMCRGCVRAYELFLARLFVGGVCKCEWFVFFCDVCLFVFLFVVKVWGWCL